MIYPSVNGKRTAAFLLILCIMMRQILLGIKYSFNE